MTSADDLTPGPALHLRQQAHVFAAFAFAYFLSALLRAATATLAPVFSEQLRLSAADLGLLAGAYFLGFASTQLPLGVSLDRFGPKRVLLGLLLLALLGCAAFAAADGLTELVAARALIGVGVSACLMAPLTCFRYRLTPSAQLRANSWLLMTGSFGMVASTAPLQAAIPHLGWRGIFWLSAALLALAIISIALTVPPDSDIPSRTRVTGPKATLGQVLRHPLFIRMAPLGFFCYGGLLAVQALWAGPWLTAVSHLSPEQAADGLLLINLCMLATFFAWGVLMPRLVRDVSHALRLVAWGLPLSLGLLLVIVWQGEGTTAAHWAAWCVASTVVSLSQPALAQAFPVQTAGRALSTYNLMIFLGVFVLQWTVGLAIDAGQQAGLDTVASYRVTFSVLLVLCAASYGWFIALGGVSLAKLSPSEEP